MSMKAIKAQAPQEKEKPSFGELIGRLATESSQLVRAEFTLAKQEAKEKIERSAESAKYFAVAAVLGLSALFTFCAFLIFVIGIWLPMWASAGLVTLAFGMGAFVAIRAGLTKWHTVNLKLEQTIETLEEDKRWIKQLELPNQQQ